jgi:hypothetical protein
MTAPPFRPLPEGEEIRPSAVPIALGISFCSAGCLLSAFALLAPEAWLDPTDHPLLRRVVAAAGLAGFAYGVYQAVLPWLRQRRLVLGGDCLQLLEGGRVLGQVPYDNVARAAVDRVGRSVAVLLLLHDYRRPDTCWDHPPGFHDYLQKTEGCDLFIMGFRGYPEDLRAKILARCPGSRPASIW